MYAKQSNEENKNGTLNYIKDVYPQAKNLQMKVIVLHIGNSYKTKDGLEVRSCKVADKTGSINLSIWGEHGSFIQPGDILALSRCYAVLFKNCLTLYVGKLGSLTKVGDFCMVFNEVPDISEPNAEWIQQQNQEGKNTPGNQGANTQSTAHPAKQTNNKPNNFRPKS
uniref:SOSS complex subunit B1-like n=1 Tax=Phallusia mammillata TaxID=59560 RepID=A0A6F9DL59_9ASCI|nr:SOSS complex subunit B1-like [Phallusia mammillata]